MCTLFTELQDGERGVWAPQHQQLITQRLVGAPIATSSLLLYLPLPPPLSSPGPRVSFTPPRLDGRRLLPESQGARAYWKTWGKIAACINNSKGEGKRGSEQKGRFRANAAECAVESSQSGEISPLLNFRERTLQSFRSLAALIPPS